jgi:hypothetical protein
MLLKRALFLSEDQVSELMCVRGGHFHPPTQHFFRKDITTSARAVIEKHWLSDVFRIALQQKCETRSGSCMFTDASTSLGGWLDVNGVERTFRQ